MSGMRQLAGTKTMDRRAHATPLAGLISGRAEYDFAVLLTDALQSSSGCQVNIGFCFARLLECTPHAVGSFNRVPSGPRLFVFEI